MSTQKELSHQEHSKEFQEILELMKISENAETEWLGVFTAALIILAFATPYLLFFFSFLATCFPDLQNYEFFQFCKQCVRFFIFLYG